MTAELNLTLRRIREQELQQSPAEFAESLARAAGELGLSIHPNTATVHQLENGHIKWPHLPYRRVLKRVCGYPVERLGFTDPQGRCDTPLYAAVLERDLESEDLSRMMRVRHDTINQWLRGRNVPQPRHRSQLCEILGREENELWPPEEHRRRMNDGSYLSVREQDVLALLCSGREDTASFLAATPVSLIAKESGVSEAAIKAILLRIYEKLGIPENGIPDRRTRLAEKAVAYGYVMTPEQRAACLLLARERPSRYAELLRDVEPAR